jgi:A/G-specific adenine glycosylase
VLGIYKTAQYVAWELAGVFQIITVIYWSWKELVSIPQPRLLFSLMKWFVVDGNVFQVLSRYFDVETDIAWPAKGVCSFGSRLMPKDNPATLNQRLWSSVLCNAYLKSNCGVCVFNDSCCAKKKKVDQLPVKSKSWRCAIVTLIIWLFLTRMKTP